MPTDLQPSVPLSPPPKVSVAMVTYNHEKFIAQAIESVLMQKTTFPIELVIGEDCSTDGTRAIVRNYAQTHPNIVRPLLHERNVGARPNFEAVLAACRGEYISYLEGDDIWLPDKLETQVLILEKQSKEVAFVYSDALQITENGEPLPQTFIETRAHIGNPPEGNIFTELWKGNFILLQASLFRRSAYGSIHASDDLYDWDTLLRISRRFKVVFSPKISVKYRIHPASIMRSGASYMDDLRVLVRLKYVEQDPTLATPELTQWLSRQLFRMHHPKRHRYLWKAFREQRTAINCLAFVCSISGIQSDCFSKWVGYGVLLKGSVRSLASKKIKIC